MQKTSHEQDNVEPQGIDAAKVFTGPVSYYYPDFSSRINIPSTVTVQLGTWNEKGEEVTGDRYSDAFYAAVLLGYQSLMKSVQAHDVQEGYFRFLITSGEMDDQNRIVPLSLSVAEKIAKDINDVLEMTRSKRRRE